jgi:hypothetical protein
MVEPEEQEGEDRIVTFALSQKDYHYELKLAQFLYKIDKIEGPTIEDLAVWCHNFAVSVLNKQLGQLYIVSAYKNKKEIEEKKKLVQLLDFENVIPNPMITANPQPERMNSQRFQFNMTM